MIIDLDHRNRRVFYAWFKIAVSKIHVLTNGGLSAMGESQGDESKMKRYSFLLIVAAVAGLVMFGSVTVQAKSAIHAKHRSGVEVSLEPRLRTEAVAQFEGNEFTVASETPGGWPDDIPHHWHSDDGDTYGTGTDWMEVGECCDDGNFEETRGMAEFDLSGAFTADSAMVEVQVAKLGGLWDQAGPGDFTIEVYTYKGNNAEDISDYNIVATLLTSFGTSGLSVSQTLQFDVTATYNAAVETADPSFGVRLQAASEPNDAAVVFGNAVLTIATDPLQPELPASPIPSGTPTGLLFMLLVVLSTGLLVLRSRSN